MKLLCTHANLKTLLRTVDGVAQQNKQLPILSNILLETENGQLHCSATDLEVGVHCACPAKIEKDGKIALSPQLLQHFLNAVDSEDNIILEIENNTLELISGTHKTKIKGYDAKDFPIIPQKINTNKTTFFTEKLQQAFTKLLPFTSNSESRIELTGIFLSFTEDIVFGVATDSFRLAEHQTQVANLIDKKEEYLTFIKDTQNLILPKKIITIINRIQEDKISWAIQDNQLFITYNNTIIMSRLIDGTYPDYKQIIPQNIETATILKKKDLLESLKITNVFADKNSGEIILNIAEDFIEISSQNQEIGESYTKIKTATDGTPQKVSLNTKYTYDGISVLLQEDVYIALHNPIAPIIIRGATKDGVDHKYTYILMPIKAQS